MMDSFQEQILGSISPKIHEILKMNVPGRDNWFEWIVNHPNQYHDPLYLPDVENGIKIIKKAIFNGEKIALFGDKDVDGITAIATFTRFLDSLIKVDDQGQIQRFKFSYIVLFEEEESADYGLTEKIVNETFSEGCTLLIVFDTGTSDFAAIQRANELGVQVIVMDHHETKGDIPPASALINPKRKDSLYPFNGLATAGLVWKFCHAFLVSFGKGQIYIWKKNNALQFEIREEGKITHFTSFKELINYLNIFTPKEISNSFRWIVDSLESKEKSEERLKRIGLNVKFEIWSEILENQFQAYNNNSENFDGFTLWGNPLTGLSGFELIKNYFENSNKEAFNLPKFYQILQLSTSKKIYKLLFPLLSLVAVGTLADMMPLEEENRIFVRAGIIQLRGGQDRCFKVMMDRIGIWTRHVRSRNISWSLVPVLNSPGRIGSGTETLSFLLKDQNKDRLHFLEVLLDRNRERKNLVEIGKKMAIEQISKEDSLKSDHLAMALLKDLPFGITGLIASRVADFFKKPSVIFMQNNEKIVGSARSYQGKNVLDMVESASECLSLFGGHKEAAGFSFPVENKEKVYRALLEYTEKNYHDLTENDNSTGIGRRQIEVDIEEINFSLIKQMDWLEPFGVGNEEPLFFIKNILPLNFKYIGKLKNHGKFSFMLTTKDHCLPNMGSEKEDDKEISIKLRSTTNFEVIGWDMADKMQALGKKEEPFDALAQLDLNYFRGELRINLILHEIMES